MTSQIALDLTLTGCACVTGEKLDLLREVDAVGVMGDGRTWDQAFAPRAVPSTDGMAADDDPFEHTFLGRAAARIIAECRGINRVTCDITSKPPGTIEWE